MTRMMTMKEKGSCSSSCLAMVSGCISISLRKDCALLDAPSSIFPDRQQR